MKQLFEDLAEEPGSDLQSSTQCHRRGVALVRLPSRFKLKRPRQQSIHLLFPFSNNGFPDLGPRVVRSQRCCLGSLPGAVNMQTALGSNLNPRLLNQERRERAQKHPGFPPSAASLRNQKLLWSRFTWKVLTWSRKGILSHPYQRTFGINVVSDAHGCTFVHCLWLEGTKGTAPTKLSSYIFSA